jgi:hypothetical protein
MKYLINFLMMIMGYTGVAQSNSGEKNENLITTFPNGEEAITIIENSESNVLKLISSDRYDKYKMLDLSNHEVNHRSEFIKRADMRNGVNQKKGNYTVIASGASPDASQRDSVFESKQGS